MKGNKQLSNFKIKEPRPKNIDLIVKIYNRKKGQGIEIFYNIKNGKLFLAEYYKHYSDGKTRKISVISDNVHLPAITPEYLYEEINKIRDNEIASRITEKEHQAEQLQRFRTQRKEHYLRKFRLKK